VSEPLKDTPKRNIFRELKNAFTSSLHDIRMKNNCLGTFDIMEMVNMTHNNREGLLKSYYQDEIVEST
jgi:hypothetical protein